VGLEKNPINIIDYIYRQIRSDINRGYPNLLDITDAEHILAHEMIYDGAREVKEKGWKN
jgi:hypothetical protein